jgi:hypothetical protein
MPLLETMHFFIKFAQIFNMFVCDFIAVIKFMNFQTLINCTHDNINICWIINLNSRTNHLAFEFVGQHIWATFLDQMGASNFVRRHDFVEMVASMKRQCEEILL